MKLVTLSPLGERKLHNEDMIQMKLAEWQAFIYW